MAEGTKFNTVTTANTIGQLRTDHNLLATELNLFSNTTGINHGTMSIVSVKGTANVSGNATFTGANTNINGGAFLINSNTNVTGTFTIRGSKLVTNTTFQSALANTNSWIQSNLANTNLAVADRIQVANAVTIATEQIISGKKTFSANTTLQANTIVAGGTLLIQANTRFVGANVDLQNNILERAGIRDYSIRGVQHGVIVSNTTLNLANGNFFSATVDNNITFSFSNFPDSSQYGEFVLLLANAGGWTITWPGTVRWPSATAPTLSGNTDILVFSSEDGGTTVLGALAAGDVG